MTLSWDKRTQVYSSYKKYSTIKFLIICTLPGSISFISKAWGGRVSDTDIVKDSVQINPSLHHHGDPILADSNFPLEDELWGDKLSAGSGVELIIPSFAKGKKQLDAKGVEVSWQIASVRIHVERVIGLIKSRYNVVDCVLPLTLLKTLSEEVVKCEIANIDKLFTVCAV